MTQNAMQRFFWLLFNWAYKNRRKLVSLKTNFFLYKTHFRCLKMKSLHSKNVYSCHINLHISFSFVLQLLFKYDLLASQVLKVEQTWKLLGSINDGTRSLGIEQVIIFSIKIIPIVFAKIKLILMCNHLHIHTKNAINLETWRSKSCQCHQLSWNNII